MTTNATTMEYQKAMNYILQMIKEHKVVVGSKLPSERDLAEEIGIGRNSTREAISILRGMGLIESRHGSGNYIAKRPDKSIKLFISIMLALGSISTKEIVEFRRAISFAVCELLLQNGLDDEIRRDLLQIIDQMKYASKDEFIELDKAFHFELIKATRNDLFVTVMPAFGEVYLEVVADVINRTDAYTREKLVEIHASLIRGIDQKDHRMCMQYMKEHYDLVAQKLL